MGGIDNGSFKKYNVFHLVIISKISFQNLLEPNSNLNDAKIDRTFYFLQCDAVQSSLLVRRETVVGQGVNAGDDNVGSNGASGPSQGNRGRSLYGQK